MPLSKDFFIALSSHTYLNKVVRKMGPQMGANHVVAGNTIHQLTETIRYLNGHNISVTADSLGELVNTREESIKTKEEILEIIDAIYSNNVKTHMSVKISQLGSEFGLNPTYENIRGILLKADKNGKTHTNIDTEKYDSLSKIQHIIDKLKGEFKNVGTIVQAYLYEADDTIDKYPELRLRLVRSAYKEDASIIFQSKEEIGANYIRIIEKRLLNSKNFTSAATHDNEITNQAKQFMKENHIGKDKMEFQMLYDFRAELAQKIANEGYFFTVYVPYGNDWFAYFMRRLAERPQNLSLAIKEFTKPKILKELTLGIGMLVTLLMSLILGIERHKK